MGLIKYIALFFLILLPIASAQEIKVLYFYNTGNVLSPDLLAQIKTVKDSWSGKIIWQELDFSNSSERIYFERYNIYSLPVAVVECYNRVNKINRSTNFGEELNATIYDCTLPRIPTITGTTGINTVVAEVKYAESNVWSDGIFIIVGLAVLLGVFVCYSRHKKSG